MKIYLTGLLFLFFSPLMVHAQSQEATTGAGRKVILYADGTWKYADEKKETVAVTETKIKEVEKKTAAPVTTLPGDCNDYLEIFEEPKSGIKSTRSKNLLIITKEGEDKEIGISFTKNNRGVISITLKPVGAGECIAEGSKINIVFTDGSKLDLSNDAFTNCKGEAMVSFGGQYGRKKQWELLRTRPVRSIRMWTQTGSVSEDLNKESQEQLIKLLSCLAG
jgi:hypothetical protein